MVNVFAAPVFFICFRECLETTIIVSVLLSFLKQTLGPEHDRVIYKKLLRQVWFGVALGLFICLVIGGAMIGVFYRFSSDLFAKTEDLWEGIFALIAAIIISIMGAALLRISKLQEKWKVKLAKAVEARDRSSETIKPRGFKHWAEKYAMFLLPFVTVLREGLEAVVFIGGVSLGMPASSFPLAVICGLGAGCLIGFIIYKGGNASSLQVFLIISTCFLYLVAAGLASRGVWSLENYKWGKIVGGDASETGTGPGSYDIRKSVWHVNCCSPQIGGGGGWGVFNSLFGWQNSATYGSVLTYNLYWITIIAVFLTMRYQENHGRLPFQRSKAAAISDQEDGHENPSASGSTTEKAVEAGKISANVRQLQD